MAEEQQKRNWEELPREVTELILSKVGPIYVLMSAQDVCKKWYRICQDPLQWRTIDMRNNNDMRDSFLRSLCCEAVDRSAGQVVDINVEYFGDNDLLEYISNRSPQLKRLRYVFCLFNISDTVLAEATEKLPLLEELELTLDNFSSRCFIDLQSRCPHLRTLKVNRQDYNTDVQPPDHVVTEASYNDVALTIAHFLPELRHLQLIGNPMTNMGLEAILDRCHRLESLDLRRCLNLNLEGELGIMCRENIRHLRLPNDSIEDVGYPAASPNEANPPSSINELENTREFSNMYGDEFGYKDYSSEDDSLDNNDFAYGDEL